MPNFTIKKLSSGKFKDENAERVIDDIIRQLEAMLNDKRVETTITYQDKENTVRVLRFNRIGCLIND